MKREILAVGVLLAITFSNMPAQERFETKDDIAIAHVDEKSPTTLEGLLDTDLFPQEQPEVRELPWYLAVVKKPASFLLLTCCGWWDRVYKRARRMVGLQSRNTDK